MCLGLQSTCWPFACIRSTGQPNLGCICRTERNPSEKGWLAMEGSQLLHHVAQQRPLVLTISRQRVKETASVGGSCSSGVKVRGWRGAQKTFHRTDSDQQFENLQDLSSRVNCEDLPLTFVNIQRTKLLCSVLCVKMYFAFSITVTKCG